MAEPRTESSSNQDDRGFSIKDALVRGVVFLAALAVLVIGGLYALGAIKDSVAYYQAVEGCDGGDRQACYELALLYCDGEGVVEDDWKCHSLLEQNCADGHGRSCAHAGWGYLRGDADGEPEHIDRALQACEAGNLRGCQVLGSIQLDHDDLPQGASAPAHYSEKACRGGLTAACYQWARRLEDEEAGHAARVEAAEVGCDRDLSEGCLELGSRLVDVPERRDEGLELLRQHCPGGRDRCFGLVEHLADTDPDAATRLAEQSCYRGAARACQWLADRADDADKRDALSAFACLSHVPEDCEVDPEDARRHGRRCSAEHPVSCAVHATHIIRDTASSWDYRVYRDAVRASCEGGFLWACTLLVYQTRGSQEQAGLHERLRGLLCDGGYDYWCAAPRSSFLADYPGSPEPERMIETFEARCEAGVVDACFALTGWYAHSLEVWHPELLPELAEHYGQRGCDLGSPRGCSTSALARFKQLPAAFVSPDVLEAQAERYQRACRMGLPQGCLQHGLMYASRGHARDAAKAKRLLEDYCRGKHPWICWRLVDYYRNGHYFERDHQRAAQIEQALCDAGATDACRE